MNFYVWIFLRLYNFKHILLYHWAGNCFQIIYFSKDNIENVYSTNTMQHVSQSLMNLLSTNSFGMTIRIAHLKIDTFSIQILKIDIFCNQLVLI